MNEGMVKPVPEASARSEGERAELERLRAEVASLRSRLRQQERPAEGSAAADGRVGRRTRQRWRRVLAAALIVLACVLAPLAVVALWTRNQVTNTDRYVRTMAPLASEPAIQRALADRITARVFASIDVKGLTDQAVDALADRGLPANTAAQLRSLEVPVANGVQSFTRTQIGKITTSAAFANAWVQANRLAHDALVKAMTGKDSGSVTIQNGTVTLNLAPLIHTVKQQLVASGFGLAAKVPETNATFVLFQSTAITKAQSGFNLLDTLGIWLSIIVLALIAAGVYVARDHRRALVGAGLGVAAGMLVLALGLVIFRSVYLNALPADVSHDAAADLYDTLVRYLRLGLRAVLVLALVVALGAFFTGTSVTAVRARDSLVRAIGWLRSGAESAGLRAGAAGVWVHAHKQALRIGAVAAAGLALVFWSQPTGKVIILLAVLLLVVLGLIEFLGRPPEVAAGAPTPKT